MCLQCLLEYQQAVLSISVSFLASWMPYAVVSVLTAFFDVDVDEMSPFVVQLPCLMAKSACIWNPLVYVCHNAEFKKAFLGTLSLTKKQSSLDISNTMETGSPNEHRMNNLRVRCTKIELADNGNGIRVSVV